jgi:hypothetical protein
MNLLEPRFPGGPGGVGRLVLRVATMLSLIWAGERLAIPEPAKGCLQVLSATLLVGLFTRASAALCIPVASFAWWRVGLGAGAPLALINLQLAALSLLGAGAYSADARLFGRSVVKLKA